jgi:high-affinity nickel-transport protein
MSLQVEEPSEPRIGAFMQSLSFVDRRSLLGMAVFVVVLHLLGFVALFLLIAPHHYHLAGGHSVFGVGVGMLAYTFGLRHAFDVDHIAAVDNVTRKLIADGAKRSARTLDTPRKPLSVGFWFSLGHSTVVFALVLLLSAGVRAMAGAVQDEASRLHTITGLIGPSVSGAFLWMVGILNLASLLGVAKVFRELRTGRYDEAELETHLDSRGLMNRLLRGLTRAVRKPWHIYSVGILFGLGFDTATEVGLLALAGGTAAFTLPFYSILVLPILFAAGMCLMDTIDGVFMNAAYGWAFAKPVRKVFFNLTITGISVIAAFVIGTIELIGVIADRLAITNGPMSAIANVKLDEAGYGIVGLFVVLWLIALGVWRFGRVEEKWSGSPRGVDPSCSRWAPPAGAQRVREAAR